MNQKNEVWQPKALWHVTQKCCECYWPNVWESFHPSHLEPPRVGFPVPKALKWKSAIPQCWGMLPKCCKWRCSKLWELNFLVVILPSLSLGRSHSPRTQNMYTWGATTYALTYLCGVVMWQQNSESIVGQKCASICSGCGVPSYSLGTSKIRIPFPQPTDPPNGSQTPLSIVISHQKCCKCLWLVVW